MNVSAIVVTRPGRRIDLQPILDTFPPEWERIVWRNGERVELHWADPPGSFKELDRVPDVGPHGRFSAIGYASHDLIYVQDDDVIVSDPQEIVGWYERWMATDDAPYKEEGYVVCNMPPEFRQHYPDSAMVGFGAAFHRNAPPTAFVRFFKKHPTMAVDDPLFLRESCRAFTTLTPRVLVDVPKTDREFASDPDRLWKQPDHIEMRERMLVLAREARDS